MREQLISLLSKIIEWGLILLAFLLPVFFLPITIETFEFPKQVFLTFFVFILVFIWIIKMILEKSVKILHSPLTMPVLFFLGAFALSTVFSIHRLSSIYGSYPRLHGGLVSILVYLLLFFLVSTNVKEKKNIGRLIFSVCLSGFLVSLIGILNFFDIYLLPSFFKNRFITPAGLASGTSVFLVLIFPILALYFFLKENLITKILAGLAGLSFIIYIILISQLAAIVSVFLAIFLIILFSRHQFSITTAIKIGITCLVIILLLVVNNMGTIRSHVPLLKNKPIQNDLTINLDTAWTITASGFKSFKILILGSGPSTYLFDFTSFKPLEFNRTNLWNIRFDKSYNEYFQLISTIGLLGLAAFFYLLVMIGKIAKEVLSKRDFLFQVCLLPVLLFAFSSLFTTSITLTGFIFWLFLGLLVSAVNLARTNGVREIEFSLATLQPRTSTNKKAEILPWVIGIIAVLIIFPLVWQMGKVLQAEIYFTQSQDEQLKDSPDANFILQSLRRARQVTPNNDTYRRTLSATTLNFAVIGLQQKTISEDTKKALLQEAISEGQAAVQYAPYNIFNWENLQTIYSLVTIEKNDELLINNIIFQETILDPLNPRHQNDLGLVYLNMRNDIETAKWYFQGAITLKPDFVDAHYNLATTYKEEGKNEKALQEYELTLSLLEQQIKSLEPIISGRSDLQRIFEQLKQSAEQIKKERENLQNMIQKEKEEEAKKIEPPVEGTPGPPETTPPPQG